jgi:hypothetical protein
MASIPLWKHRQSEPLCKPLTEYDYSTLSFVHLRRPGYAACLVWKMTLCFISFSASCYRFVTGRMIILSHNILMSKATECV